jgi:uncharacterized metal-binding protein
MSEKSSPRCAKCPTKVCAPPIGSSEVLPLEKAPAFCPMKNMPEVIKGSLDKYQNPDVREFARQASIQEFECYENTPEGFRTKNPRILELIQFSKKMGYQKLGIAFCAGLTEEARIITEILENNGLDVVSVRCKTGRVPKSSIGIKPEQQIGGPDCVEPMCNPIAQAEILNVEKVDMAVMVGLCLGHDTLFIQNCRVPITVLAVKDRVTGHNPLAAIYTSSSYYSRLKPQKKKL